MAGVPAPKNSDVGPGELFRLMRGQAEHLGHEADWRVERLTDLPPLLERVGG